MRKKKPPRDQQARDRVIHERRRNVIVDAGAGTGKTTLIVARVLELVAPSSDDCTPMLLERVAVLTFTRKAAGELRYRIREALLRALRDVRSACRRQRLQSALETLDAAFVGTIHSFADRLLRMRPIEARLSPSYRIVECTTPLVRETFQLLLRSAEAGHLAEAVRGAAGSTGASSQRERVALQRAGEAQQTILDFERAGLRIVTTEYQPGVNSPAGLDRFVSQFLDNRDLCPGFHDHPPGPPDLVAVQRAIREHVASVERTVMGRGYGPRWLLGRAAELAATLDTNDPVEAVHVIQAVLNRRPPDMTKRDDFRGEDQAYEIWRDFWGRGRVTEGAVGAVVRPLHDWMGVRLVRMGPVLLSLYDHVKAQHEAVDYLDLLLVLRDLLRQPALQQFYSGLFDHIFIDEFQDTDPVQAEILFYLCGEPPTPDAGQDLLDWRKLPTRSGALTIVGDPQQSIYRFRRADIQVYREVCDRLGDTCREALEVNFRSRPELIELFNERLANVLGRDMVDEQLRFDPEGCQAYYRPLWPSPVFERAAGTPPEKVLHELSYNVPDWHARPALEGEVLARHLWWLVHQSKQSVRDPDAAGAGHAADARPVGFGDIAVLCRRTTHLLELFEQFDRHGIPFAARGGNLFLRQDSIRRFILGLRALSDRGDGAAQAALHAPPFFAIDYADVVTRSTAYQRAVALIEDLRRQRFDCPPAVTALRLLERTAFARAVALSPNGERRLEAVRELIGHMDAVAHEHNIAFDAVTAELRRWLDEPERIIDQAAPVQPSAVQVLTTYQAKGLEFPVVALWDASDKLQARDMPDAWIVNRPTGRWQIKMQNFEAGSPADPGHAAHVDDPETIEERFFSAERRRLVYVAATRARDLLIVPCPRHAQKGQGADSQKYACAAVLEGPSRETTTTFEPHGEVPEVPAFPELQADAAAPGMANAARAWHAARAAATHHRAQTAFVTEFIRAAHGSRDTATLVDVHLGAEPTTNQEVQLELFAAPPATDAGAPTGDQQTDAESSELRSTDVAEAKPRDEVSRYGRHFGSAVHKALEWALSGRTAALDVLVEKALAISGHANADLAREALADVQRALHTLRQAELIPAAGQRQVYTEYPVHTVVEDSGMVLRGSIDALIITPDTATIIDFKTDPPDARERLQHYNDQLQHYITAVQAIAVPRTVRAGLLFTADGHIEWA